MSLKKNKMIKKIFNKIKSSRYSQDESGLSVVEMGILFPVLLSMMMAVYDLGQGIVVNQKTMAAAQIIGDLVTRVEVVDFDMVTDVINAGELALAPYSTVTFGYDIASIVFDEDSDPVILWRVTENMDQSDSAINSTEGLGEEGEGVVVVSVAYEYVPYFSSFVIDSFNMTERAFLRGRKSATVTCLDCP